MPDITILTYLCRFLNLHYSFIFISFVHSYVHRLYSYVHVHRFRRLLIPHDLSNVSCGLPRHFHILPVSHCRALSLFFLPTLFPQVQTVEHVPFHLFTGTSSLLIRSDDLFCLHLRGLEYISRYIRPPTLIFSSGFVTPSFHEILRISSTSNFGTYEILLAIHLITHSNNN